MKKSAGILVYRKKEGKLEVFLEHMGGPYWAKKDEGAWSIPKGEYIEESAKDAALREFQEETGFQLNQELTFLKTVKISSTKLLTIFIAEEDLDPEKIVSNTFELEWPPKSGLLKTFPEMDKADWFTIEEAFQKVVKNQVVFLQTLEEVLR